MNNEDRILPDGARVKLQRLQNAAHLNGATGTVLRPLSDGRYAVKLENDDARQGLSVKRENLVVLRATFDRTAEDDPAFIASGEVLICTTSSSRSSSSADREVCLGGLASGAANKVPAEGSSVYASLPRPCRLPPPAFGVRKTNKKAHAVYMKIWDGNFRLKWVIRNRDASGHTLIAVASLDGDTAGVVEQFVGNILYIKLEQYGEHLSVMKSGSTGVNEEFSASFKEHAKNELGHRVLYHFLRSHGACLMPHSPMLVNAACNLLERTHKEAVKSLLDIKVLRCDLFLNHDQGPLGPYGVGIAQTKVGEALEATGELNDAALLYRHTAETYFDPTRAIDWHSNLQEFSALAYKRDNQLAKAEEGYIRALHFRRRCACEGGRAWDLNEPKTTNLLCNFLIMMDSLHGDSGKRTRKVCEGEIFPVFVALLFTAGFQGAGLSHGLVNELGSAQVSLLKGEIRSNRERALAALVAATECPEKAHFYDAMARCVPANVSIQVGETHKRDWAAERLSGIQDAQNTLGTGVDVPVIDMHMCGYKGCNSENGPSMTLQTCPCKTKGYCSKQCQVSEEVNCHALEGTGASYSSMNHK